MNWVSPTFTYNATFKTCVAKFLTTKEWSLFFMNIVIPLKLRGIYAESTAPPLPSLPIKVLQVQNAV